MPITIDIDLAKRREEAEKKKKARDSASKIGAALTPEVLESIGRTNPGAASFLGELAPGLISGEVSLDDLGTILGEVSPMQPVDPSLQELQKAQAEFLKGHLPQSPQGGTETLGSPTSGTNQNVLGASPAGGPQFQMESIGMGPGGLTTTMKRVKSPIEIQSEIDQEVAKFQAKEEAKNKLSKEQLAKNLGSTLNSLKGLMQDLPGNVDVPVVNRLIGFGIQAAGSLGINEAASDYASFAKALAGQLARVFTGETGARLSDQEQERVQDLLNGMIGKGPKARAMRLARIDDVLEGAGGKRLLEGQLYQLGEGGSYELVTESTTQKILDRLSSKFLGGR